MDVYTVNISEIGDLLGQQLQSVFQNMTGLTLQSASSSGCLPTDPWSMAISTKGDYRMTFLMCANWDVWRAVARCMNHGKDVPKENVFAYVSELFNVVCGRVISAVNSKYRCSARFSIPKILQGGDTSNTSRDYFCDCGTVKLSMADVTFPCDCPGVATNPKGQDGGYRINEEKSNDCR